MAIKNKIGFTLIEALVLLALYSVVLLSMLEFSVNIALEYNRHHRHFRIESKGKIAYLWFDNAISYASRDANNQLVWGTDGSTNDALKILQSPVNCRGQSSTAPYVIELFIDTPSFTNQSSLYCREGARSKEELIDGVEALGVRYVIENNNTIYYKNADEVESLSLWQQVKRVEISLLITEDQAFASTKAVEHTFSLFNNTKTVNTAQKHYQQYHFTFSLKNKL